MLQKGGSYLNSLTILTSLNKGCKRLASTSRRSAFQHSKKWNTMQVPENLLNIWQYKQLPSLPPL
eukprot:277286-Amphidinium_carterae.3